MRFEELETKVLKWQYDKGIIQAGNRTKQALKTLEEVGELLEEIADDNIEGIIDAIGDITVTLIGQCEINGIKFLDCLESAYNEIANRTGKIINGTFVKDSK